MYSRSFLFYKQKRKLINKRSTIKMVDLVINLARLKQYIKGRRVSRSEEQQSKKKKKGKKLHTKNLVTINSKIE